MFFARIKHNYQLIRGPPLSRGESRDFLLVDLRFLFAPASRDGRQYSSIVSRNLAVDELGSGFKGALETTLLLAEESSGSFSFRERGVLTYYETICKSYENSWEGKLERGERRRTTETREKRKRDTEGRRLRK